MLYILIVSVWFFGSTGREPVAEAFTVESPGQCLELRGKVLDYESHRSEVRLVRATCVAVSGDGNSI